jgi:hypothetical protein
MSAEAPQPPNVNIRTAGPGDLPRIQQITREVFAPASIDAKIEQRCGRPAESWHVL